MSNTPILNISQVAPNQNQKEATINTAIAILEAAMNDSLAVDASAGSVTLTEDQWTKYFLFKVSGHAVPRTLGVKDRPRQFTVANDGASDITVTPTGSVGASVIVPPGKIVLMATDGDGNIWALSSGVGALNDLSDVVTTAPVDGMVLGYVGSTGVWQPITIAELLDLVTSFTDLSDVPASYTGNALKQVRVNAAMTGLEFFTYVPPFIPYTLGQLSDVENATGQSDGDVLRYRDGVWQAEPITSLGATSFASLTDTPADYSAGAGAIVRINAGATGLEFFNLPPIPSQLGHLADVETGTGISDGDILRYRDGVWQPEPFEAGSGSGATTFLGLNDVPDAFGPALSFVRVNAGQSGLEFIQLPPIPSQLGHLADVETGTGLTDGYILRYRDGVWQGEPFVLSFKDLSDTPDYANVPGRYVRVNAGGTGIEYHTLPPIPTQLGHLTDVETGTGISDGDLLRYRDGVWQPEPNLKDTTTKITDRYVNDMTLELTHAGAMVQMDKATAISVTVPANASVAFPLGSEISITQRGAGQVTVVAGGGVTINYPADMSLLSRTQHSVLGLLKTGTNEWLLFGDLEAL